MSGSRKLLQPMQTRVKKSFLTQTDIFDIKVQNTEKRNASGSVNRSKKTRSPPQLMIVPNASDTRRTTFYDFGNPVKQKGMKKERSKFDSTSFIDKFSTKIRKK